MRPFQGTSCPYHSSKQLLEDDQLVEWAEIQLLVSLCQMLRGTDLVIFVQACPIMMEKQTAVCKGTGFFMPLTFRTAAQRRSVSPPATRHRKSRRQQCLVTVRRDLSDDEGEVTQMENPDQVKTLGSAEGLSDSAFRDSSDHAALASPAPHPSSYGYTYAWQFVWNGQGGFWLPAVRGLPSPYVVPVPAVGSCTWCSWVSYQQHYSHDQAMISKLDSKRSGSMTPPAAAAGAGVPMHQLSPPGLQ